MTTADPNLNFLKFNPIFRRCLKRDLARIIPFIQQQDYQADDVIFTQGHMADSLYFVQQGHIELHAEDKCIDHVSRGFIGEEAAIGLEQYDLTAIATAPASIFLIPSDAINKITETNSHLISDFYQSLIDHYLEHHLPEPEVRPPTIIGAPNAIFNKNIGWILALIIPVLVYGITALPTLNIDENIQLFLTVFSSALVLWTFNLVSEFIPAIIIMFALLVLGIAPTAVVLSGFSSSSFFLALSIFALGAVLATSGLTYRFVLMLLRVVPKTQLSYSLTLFLIGFFLTPVLPSANGRTQLTTPLLVDMVDALRLRRKGKGATRLAFAAFTGSTFMSFAFLSSKPIQFVLLGLLPQQVRDRFSLPYWTMAAAVAAVVAIAGFLTISHFLFRNQEKTDLPTEQLNEQLAMLGPMTNTEWVALGSISVFLLGVLTSSLHGIDIPWVGLFILCFLLAGKVIAKQEFRTSIDWPFLTLLASLIGLSRSISYIGFDKWLSDYLSWLGTYMRDNFSLFVLLFATTIFLARLLLPMALIVPLFGTIFIPLAELNGVNAWIIAFIILIISDGWFMPYQYSPTLLFASMTTTPELFDSRLLRQGNILMNAVRVMAIYASFFYWHWLGIF